MKYKYRHYPIGLLVRNILWFIFVSLFFCVAIWSFLKVQIRLRHKEFDKVELNIKANYFDMSRDSIHTGLYLKKDGEMVNCIEGEVFVMNLMVINTSPYRLAPGIKSRIGPGKPVNIGIRIFSRDQLISEQRYIMKKVIPPNGGVAHREEHAEVVCPPPGYHKANVELVQEGVGWQSDFMSQGFIKSIFIESQERARL